MFKELDIKIKNIKTEDNKYLLEAELGVLHGIEDVLANQGTGNCQISFDSHKIEQGEIIKKIKSLGFEVDDKNMTSSSSQKHTYFVAGMHCAACKVLTEKKLLNKKGVKSVKASVSKGRVEIKYSGACPNVGELNELFKKDGYTFTNHPKKKNNVFLDTKKNGEVVINKQKLHDLLIVLGVSLLLIILFTVFNKSGLTSLISVNSNSALPMFLLFGILAGLSSCAALVGGIILSMSKQWSAIYSPNDSNARKLQPHILFNVGRLVSYTLLGGLLGAVGGILQLSFTFTAILIFAVSIMMFFLALQMLGVKQFQRFQITAPKFLTKYASDEKNFQGRYMPFTMGALTFFLPCGFTITAQGLALASGSPIQGALIMLFFALGTLPILLTIGLSSVKFSKNPKLTARFMKVAGVLVLFFAMFNVNSQLNVLGWKSFNDISFSHSRVAQATKGDLPPLVNGKQVIKMEASAYGYSPNKFRVRAGVPVRWEITDKGTSGCTNAVISKGLFAGEIPLTHGETSVKEFTPQKPGTYKFSCWMGMVSGVFEVVDDRGQMPIVPANEIVPSGAQGCGCGGGGGTCGG